MPKCGDNDCGRIGIGNITGCTRKGIVEDWETPPRVLSEEWDCPGLGYGDSDDSSRPWTVDYLSMVAQEKSIQLYNFLVFTVYGNPFYWGLFKALFLFGYGLKLIFRMSRALTDACDKKKKCMEMRRKYSE